MISSQKFAMKTVIYIYIYIYIVDVHLKSELFPEFKRYRTYILKQEDASSHMEFCKFRGNKQIHFLPVSI